MDARRASGAKVANIQSTDPTRSDFVVLNTFKLNCFRKSGEASSATFTKKRPTTLIPIPVLLNIPIKLNIACLKFPRIVSSTNCKRDVINRKVELSPGSTVNQRRNISTT